MSSSEFGCDGICMFGRAGIKDLRSKVDQMLPGLHELADAAKAKIIMDFVIATAADAVQRDRARKE